MTHGKHTDQMELEPELAELDAFLASKAAPALAASSSQLGGDFKSRLLARATAAPVPAHTARVIDMGLAWRAAAALLVVVGLGAAVMAVRAHLAPVGQLGFSVAEEKSLHGDIRRGDIITAAEPMTLRLDDMRIHAMLDSGARLEVVSGSQVRLTEGDAWFHVRPNSGRFVVETGHGTVSVVGTAFGVKHAGGDVAVHVTRGKVRAEFDGRGALVSAGEVWSRLTGMVGTTATSHEPPSWATELLERESQERFQLFFPSAAAVESHAGK